MKRILIALVATVVVVPFLAAGSAAAAGENTPPPVQELETFCEGVPTEPDPFTDIAGNTFEREIECVAALGITEGGPNGLPATQYGPSLLVSRAAMASFIARLMDAADSLDVDDNINALPSYEGEPTFTDIGTAQNPDNPHFTSINRLQAAGIVMGGPAGHPATEYGPHDLVTRAQMASFIIRAIEYMTGEELTTSADYFNDDEDAVEHQGNINALSSRGIVQGTDSAGNTYDPSGNVTRAQMAGFIGRTPADLEEQGLITPVEPSTDAPEATVALDSTSVVRGGHISGTVTGDDIEGISVSGCGVTDQDLGADSDSARDGWQFAITVPAGQVAGECTLTFTTEFADDATDTDTVSITVTAPPTGGGGTPPGDVIAPTIVTATLTGETVGAGEGVVDSGDEATLVFSEEVWAPVTADPTPALGDFPLITLTDADGDVIDIRCGDPGLLEPGDGVTEATCVFSGSATPNQGDTAVVTLIENPQVITVGGDGIVNYPLTINTMTGVEDLAGNDVDLTTGDKVIEAIDVVSPTIEDASVSAEATSVVQAGDEATLEFSEEVWAPVTADPDPDLGDFPLITLTDADGDVIRIRCGIPGELGFEEPGDGITDAGCLFSGSALPNQGDTVTVTLLENAEVVTVGGDGIVNYPLTIDTMAGVEDLAGNPVDLAASDTLVEGFVV